ncbi:NnrS family protein (plasmid) [Rhizobium sp. 32-5/1]|uniref:NnrS family protein n=1 Tax=Rhizobium sp. 32-5/1 TaxID=3019602 RepID=UPI00240D496A|nr:NnrS family protein [Rhizobium sp. 32-5/1]WEZ85744.1 NnrS family protein [Rhizobium sp. 32-5/1]
MAHDTIEPQRRKGGIPRGLSATGPVLFSYGFRPFFLGGAAWACVAMAVWIAAISGRMDIGGSYGAPAWHAHEMLFGFGSAIVAGFLLTAVPNWTGRLPVSGRPLMLLFLIWFAGRAVMLAPDAFGLLPSILVESAFLPTMLVVCLREILAGRKWSDLRVVAGLGALAIANACYHYETVLGGGADHSTRLALAGLTMMIVIVGGRMLPSFTRNWLSKAGRTDFPVPYNRFDLATIVLTVPVFVLWIAQPEGTPTAIAACLAAVLHSVRLRRWGGWKTSAEPLVMVLHVAYAFVPIGFTAISLSAAALLDLSAAIHVFTVGTVSAMMLAVMTRATRGHTGRELTASFPTCFSYGAIFLCALTRPLATLIPEHIVAVYSVAAALWIGAFGLYLIEYAPMLLFRRKPSARAA